MYLVPPNNCNVTIRDAVATNRLPAHEQQTCWQRYRQSVNQCYPTFSSLTKLNTDYRTTIYVSHIQKQLNYSNFKLNSKLVPEHKRQCMYNLRIRRVRETIVAV